MALSAIDQDQYTTKIPPLDAGKPKYYWIFQNMDFKRWALATSPVLWLSGPSECNLQQVSWHLANLANSQEVQETGDLVLYFFCSTLTRKGRRSVRSVSNTTVFVHTLLCQIIRELPDDGITAVTVFLNTLLKAIKRRPGESPLDPNQGYLMTMEAVIDASSDSDLWGALEQVINSENNLRLLLIVDGLEEAETHEDKIIGGIRLFIERLEGKVNALLTSRPEDDIKALLKGILSIEYDKERNGMTISPSVP